MALTWGGIAAWGDKAKARIPIGLAFLGLALSRAVFGWVLGISRTVPEFYLSNHTVVDAGEILGFLLVFLAVKNGRFFCGKPERLLLLGFTYALSVGVLALSYFNIPLLLIWLALFASGFCYAAVLVAWLEFYGMLSSGAMVFAYAGSAAFNSIIWFCIDGATFSVAAIVAVVCALGTIFLLVWSLSGQNMAAIQESAPGFSLRSTRKSLGLIIVWTSILSFAFGVGDAITQMGYSTAAAKAGVAIIGVAVVVGISVLQDKFDSTFLCTTAIVCIVMGLAATLLNEVEADVAQVLLSAGHEGSMLLAYFAICARASHLHSSAAYGASIVAAISLIMLQLGAASGSFVLRSGGVFILFAFVIAAALVGGFLATRQIQLEFSLMVPENTEDPLLALAKEKGLSDRETVVYTLMSQGKNAAEISEELFIAKSTVRAHMHRIYEKFDVKSRQEFDRIVLEERYR